MRRRGAVVLLYHRLGHAAEDPWSLCVTPEHFEAHLEILAPLRRVSVSQLASDLADGRLLDGSVAITFDDGYAESIAVARPLLERYDTPAAFYVPSGAVGSAHEFWWDETEAILLGGDDLPGQLDLDVGDARRSWSLAEHGKRGGDAPAGSASNSWPGALEAPTRRTTWRAWQEAPPTRRHAVYRELWSVCHQLTSDRRDAVLNALRHWAGHGGKARASHRCVTADELADLASSPLVEIGGHSVTHPSLGRLSPRAQRWEIVESVHALSTMARCSVRSFAYPFGKPSDFSDETVSIVRGAGLHSAFVNDAGVVTPSSDSLRLPRLFVEDWDGPRFAAELSAVWL